MESAKAARRFAPSQAASASAALQLSHATPCDESSINATDEPPARTPPVAARIRALGGCSQTRPSGLCNTALAPLGGDTARESREGAACPSGSARCSTRALRRSARAPSRRPLRQELMTAATVALRRRRRPVGVRGPAAERTPSPRHRPSPSCPLRSGSRSRRRARFH